MKRIQKPRKLSLKRRTIRVLRDADLGRQAGASSDVCILTWDLETSNEELWGGVKAPIRRG